MAKQWVVNTASGPRYIAGVLLAPGEGVFVNDGPDGAAAPAGESTVVALASSRLASMAAAGNAVPSGTLLKDPGTGQIYGQSVGVGGYTALGGDGAGAGIFRGVYTWATRPLSGLNVGDTIRVSDVGRAPGTIFKWTGSRWRHLYSFILARNIGSVTSPVATLTGVTSGVFTLPNALATFADMFEPGDELEVSALATKIGGGGTADINIYLGTAGGITDSLVRPETLTNVTNRTMNARTQIQFSGLTTFSGPAGLADNSVSTSQLLDRSTNVNLAAAMSITIALANANAADTFKLVSCGLRAL